MTEHSQEQKPETSNFGVEQILDKQLCDGDDKWAVMRISDCTWQPQKRTASVPVKIEDFRAQMLKKYKKMEDKATQKISFFEEIAREPERVIQIEGELGNVNEVEERKESEGCETHELEKTQEENKVCLEECKVHNAVMENRSEPQEHVGNSELAQHGEEQENKHVGNSEVIHHGVEQENKGRIEDEKNGNEKNNLQIQENTEGKSVALENDKAHCQENCNIEEEKNKASNEENQEHERSAEENKKSSMQQAQNQRNSIVIIEDEKSDVQEDSNTSSSSSNTGSGDKSKTRSNQNQNQNQGQKNDPVLIEDDKSDDQNQMEDENSNVSNQNNDQSSNVHQNNHSNREQHHTTAPKYPTFPQYNNTIEVPLPFSSTYEEPELIQEEKENSTPQKETSPHKEKEVTTQNQNIKPLRDMTFLMTQELPFPLYSAMEEEEQDEHTTSPQQEKSQREQEEQHSQQVQQVRSKITEVIQIEEEDELEMEQPNKEMTQILPNVWSQPIQVQNTQSVQNIEQENHPKTITIQDQIEIPNILQELAGKTFEIKHTHKKPFLQTSPEIDRIHDVPDNRGLEIEVEIEQDEPSKPLPMPLILTNNEETDDSCYIIDTRKVEMKPRTPEKPVEPEVKVPKKRGPKPKRKRENSQEKDLESCQIVPAEPDIEPCLIENAAFSSDSGSESEKVLDFYDILNSNLDDDYEEISLKKNTVRLEVEEELYWQEIPHSIVEEISKNSPYYLRASQYLFSAREKPIDVFFRMFPKENFSNIAKETNAYARRFMGSEVGRSVLAKRGCRVKTWKATDADEIMNFIGMNLLMGMVKLPSRIDYWQTKTDYFQTSLPQLMKFKRYGMLSRFFQLRAPSPFQDASQTMQARLDFLNKSIYSFKKLVVPYEELSLDLKSPLYRSPKGDQWGMRCMSLCCSSGFTLDFKISRRSQRNRVNEATTILDMMHDFRFCNHKLRIKNHLVSPGLVEKLKAINIYTSGETDQEFVGIGDVIRNKKLNSKEDKAYFKSKNILAVKSCKPNGKPFVTICNYDASQMEKKTLQGVDLLKPIQNQKMVEDTLQHSVGDMHAELLYRL